jgi:hypothetical protein
MVASGMITPDAPEETLAQWVSDRIVLQSPAKIYGVALKAAQAFDVRSFFV